MLLGNKKFAGNLPGFRFTPLGYNFYKYIFACRLYCVFNFLDCSSTSGIGYQVCLVRYRFHMGTWALCNEGAHQPVIAVVCSYEYQARGLRNIESMEIAMYMNLNTIYDMQVFDLLRIFLPSHLEGDIPYTV